MIVRSSSISGTFASVASAASIGSRALLALTVASRSMIESLEYRFPIVRYPLCFPDWETPDSLFDEDRGNRRPR